MEKLKVSGESMKNVSREGNENVGGVKRREKGEGGRGRSRGERGKEKRRGKGNVSVSFKSPYVTQDTLLKWFKSLFSSIHQLCIKRVLV